MRKTAIIICLGLLFNLFFSHGLMDVMAAPNISESAISINKENLKDFFDQFITEQMETHNIAGALGAAVKDGEVVFSKGYGYANVQKSRPMDSASTVFRAASLSKLFTATALMQLQEKGLVDFNTDINEYLGEDTISNTYSKPITIAHLLTHSAGFDERFLNVRFSDPQETTGLYEDVIGMMPPRVRQPGEINSYSNYSFALAGYILEVVTGMKFEDYVEENIFRPLDMTLSSFREPPSDSLINNMSEMYSYRNGEYVALSPLYHNQRPAGALYSTIEDLSRFMAAQLQGGTYGGGTILDDNSVEMMQTPQFVHHPKLEGQGYGVYEIRNQGLRVIGHNGDLNGAYSIIYLLPEIDYGMVFHFNTGVSSNTEDDPRALLLDKFTERFYPQYKLDNPVRETNVEVASIKDLSGYYRVVRYAKKTPGKFLMPTALAQLVVTQDKKGSVNISMPFEMMPETNWQPYEDGLFRRNDKETYLSYRTNDKGRVEYIFFTSGGLAAIERVPWYEVFWLILGLLVFSQLIFITSTVGWGLGSIIGWIRKRPRSQVSKQVKWARIVARIISILGIGIIAALLVMIVNVMETLGSPLLFLLPAVSLGGWVIFIGSLFLLFTAIGSIQKREIGKKHLVLYSLIALGGLSFTWVLNYGNLLKFMGM